MLNNERRIWLLTTPSEQHFNTTSMTHTPKTICHLIIMPTLSSLMTLYNLRRHQWRQSWHYDNYMFSVYRYRHTVLPLTKISGSSSGPPSWCVGWSAQICGGPTLEEWKNRDIHVLNSLLTTQTKVENLSTDIVWTPVRPVFWIFWFAWPFYKSHLLTGRPFRYSTEIYQQVNNSFCIDEMVNCSGGVRSKEGVHLVPSLQWHTNWYMYSYICHM